MNCVVSPLYSKDELKNLHFECEYCGLEMCPEEVRECSAKVEKCVCGNRLGSTDYSVGRCLNCNKKL
jgi:hypothetical protein